MTQHLHSQFVEGCYRCELGQDEVPLGFREALIEAVDDHWPFDGEADDYDLAALAAAIEEALLALPVGQRMAAMGLREATWRDCDNPNVQLWTDAPETEETK